MELEKCPICMKIRVYDDDGKCTFCGYCSGIRTSINALYSSKKTTSRYEQIKTMKRLRRNDSIRQ